MSEQRPTKPPVPRGHRTPLVSGLIWPRGVLRHVINRPQRAPCLITPCLKDTAARAIRADAPFACQAPGRYRSSCAFQVRCFVAAVQLPLGTASLRPCLATCPTKLAPRPPHTALVVLDLEVRCFVAAVRRCGAGAPPMAEASGAAGTSLHVHVNAVHPTAGGWLSWQDAKPARFLRLRCASAMRVPCVSMRDVDCTSTPCIRTRMGGCAVAGAKYWW